MNLSQAELTNVITRVYDVLLAPEKWPAVLNLVAECAGGRAANIFQGDSQHLELHAALFSDALGGLMDDPSKAAIMNAERPLYSAIPEIIGLPEMMTESELLMHYGRLGFPPLDLDPVHEWLRKSHGINHRITSPLNQRTHYFDFLTVHFGPEVAEPPEQSMQICNALLPHLAKALEVNRPFALLEVRYRAVLDVLDKLHLGVILIGEDKSVWLKNAAAQQMIERGDALAIDRRGGLTGTTSSGSSILEHSLTSLTKDRVNQLNSLTVRLPRTGGSKQLLDAYVADISILSGLESVNDTGFVLVLVDPDRTEIVDLSNVAQLFGLTKTEEFVCKLVVEGYTNKEIAQVRNVSPETVNTQVRSVYAKTNTNRRSDVVRLAHSVNIPIAKP